MLQSLIQLISESMLHSLIVLLNFGYAGVVLILLIWHVSKYRREDAKQFLQTANLIFLFVSGCYFLYTVMLLLQEWQSGYLYEQYAFYRRMFNVNLWLAWYFIKVLLPFLFLFRKVRQSFVLPIIIILLAYPLEMGSMMRALNGFYISEYKWHLINNHTLGFIYYSIFVIVAYLLFRVIRSYRSKGPSKHNKPTG